MAQFRAAVRRFQVSRYFQQKLLLSMLLGSALGVLCACFRFSASEPDLMTLIRAVSIPRAIFRALLFPALILMATVLQKRFLFEIVFFLKGLLTAFFIRVLADSGFSVLLDAIPFLMLEMVLPLPFFLFAASIRTNCELEAERILFLLLLMLLPVLSGVLLQTLFF